MAPSLQQFWLFSLLLTGQGLCRQIRDVTYLQPKADIEAYDEICLTFVSTYLVIPTDGSNSIPATLSQSMGSDGTLNPGDVSSTQTSIPPGSQGPGGGGIPSVTGSAATSTASPLVFFPTATDNSSFAQIDIPPGTPFSIYITGLFRKPNDIVLPGIENSPAVDFITLDTSLPAIVGKPPPWFLGRVLATVQVIESAASPKLLKARDPGDTYAVTVQIDIGTARPTTPASDANGGQPTPVGPTGGGGGGGVTDSPSMEPTATSGGGAETSPTDDGTGNPGGQSTSTGGDGGSPSTADSESSTSEGNTLPSSTQSNNDGSGGDSASQTSSAEQDSPTSQLNPSDSTSHEASQTNNPPVPTTSGDSSGDSSSSGLVPPVSTTSGVVPPVITTDPPVVTTDPPVVTTDPPVVTTDPPVVTTDPPVITTATGNIANVETLAPSSAIIEGARYPRASKFTDPVSDNEGLILAYTLLQDNGAVKRMQAMVSFDDGDNWSDMTEVQGHTIDRDDNDEPHIIQLPDKTLLYVFRNPSRDEDDEYTDIRITLHYSNNLAPDTVADPNAKAWPYLAQIHHLFNDENAPPGTPPVEFLPDWTPVLRLLESGDLHCYFSQVTSADEEENIGDQNIVLYKSTADGEYKDWASYATPVGSEDENTIDGNPGVVTTPGGKTMLVFDTYASNVDGAKRSIQYVTSDDDGENWSERTTLYQPEDETRGAAFPQIIVVGETLVVSFLSDEDLDDPADEDGSDFFIVTSADDGENWSLPKKIASGAQYPGLLTIDDTLGTFFAMWTATEGDDAGSMVSQKIKVTEEAEEVEEVEAV